jgi:fermentation-respiration switch protein FrsA (DUF1100 family)
LIPRRAQGVLIWFVLVPLVAYLAVLSFLYLVQRQLLYFPDRWLPPVSALADLGVREVRLTTADGLTLVSWYVPPREGRPAIAYFHGNGGSIAHRIERLQRFAQEGYGVLLAEYRGYGGNPGSPSEAGLHADAAAALDFLAVEGIAGPRLVLFGESLGSAVAVAAAAEREVAALILESPFTSIAAVAQHHYPFVPVALLIRDRFDCFAPIGRVRAPILMLQGGNDRVVPARFGRALYDAAPEPKEAWFAADGGHEDLVRFGAIDAAIAFIERRRSSATHTDRRSSG